MFRRLILMGFLCLGIAACATPHALTSEQVRSLGITQVNVIIPPKTHLRWATEAERFEKTQAASPEAVQEHLRQRLKQIVQNAYEFNVKPSFQGPRKVSLNVTVRHISVPSLVERVLINDMALFKADFEVVDIKTGAVVTRFEDVSGSSVKMVGGILAPLSDAAGLSGSDPAIAIITSHANIARDWLANGK